MKIVQYVRFTEPGELNKLEQLMKESESELDLRSKITKVFKVSSIDAGVIVKNFRSKFNQIKNQ